MTGGKGCVGGCRSWQHLSVALVRRVRHLRDFIVEVSVWGGWVCACACVCARARARVCSVGMCVVCLGVGSWTIGRACGCGGSVRARARVRVEACEGRVYWCRCGCRCLVTAWYPGVGLLSDDTAFAMTEESMVKSAGFPAQRVEDV